jgi:nitroreductase
MDNELLVKAVMQSQACQRNWDLTRAVEEKDLETLITAATQCPSKQNIAFYQLHVVKDRDVIERIHLQTTGFVVRRSPQLQLTTNSQTLANVLFVFEEYMDLTQQQDADRNQQTRALQAATDDKRAAAAAQIRQDQLLSVGVASGYLALSAALLGYSTGFCSCFDAKAIEHELGLGSRCLLLVGVGYPDDDKNTRQHHKIDYQYPHKTKQPITVRR